MNCNYILFIFYFNCSWSIYTPFLICWLIVEFIGQILSVTNRRKKALIKLHKWFWHGKKNSMNEMLTLFFLCSHRRLCQQSQCQTGKLRAEFLHGSQTFNHRHHHRSWDRIVGSRWAVRFWWNNKQHFVLNCFISLCRKHWEFHQRVQRPTAVVWIRWPGLLLWVLGLRWMVTSNSLS